MPRRNSNQSFRHVVRVILTDGTRDPAQRESFRRDKAEGMKRAAEKRPDVRSAKVISVPAHR